MDYSIDVNKYIISHASDNHVLSGAPIDATEGAIALLVRKSGISETDKAKETAYDSLLLYANAEKDTTSAKAWCTKTENADGTFTYNVVATTPINDVVTIGTVPTITAMPTGHVADADNKVYAVLKSGVKYIQLVLGNTSKDVFVELPKSAGDLIIETTQSDLYDLMTGGKLNPGTLYRVIDYKGATVTNYAEADACANHPLDLIFHALDESTLNGSAMAAIHEGDIYLADAKLDQWEVKAEVTEDGVQVTYMKDQYGNEADFDHLNALWEAKITAKEDPDGEEMFKYLDMTGTGMNVPTFCVFGDDYDPQNAVAMSSPRIQGCKVLGRHCCVYVVDDGDTAVNSVIERDCEYCSTAGIANVIGQACIECCISGIGSIPKENTLASECENVLLGADSGSNTIEYGYNIAIPSMYGTTIEDGEDWETYADTYITSSKISSYDNTVIKGTIRGCTINNPAELLVENEIENCQIGCEATVRVDWATNMVVEDEAYFCANTARYVHVTYRSGFVVVKYDSSATDPTDINNYGDFLQEGLYIDGDGGLIDKKPSLLGNIENANIDRNGCLGNLYVIMGKQFLTQSNKINFDHPMGLPGNEPDWGESAATWLYLPYMDVPNIRVASGMKVDDEMRRKTYVYCPEERMEYLEDLVDRLTELIP